MTTPAVIGITGGIGSGKSAATARFEQLGIDVIDADLAARAVVEPGSAALTAIAGHFGPELITPAGALDRAALRQRVFADEGQRRWLEQLLHPLIGDYLMQQLAAASSPYVLLSSPLLLETTQRQLCRAVIVVDVPETLQLSRTMQRDANDEAQVRRIMAAQLSREKRLAGADYVLDNSGTLHALEQSVDALHAQLLADYAC